jgi:hypothetical protein
MTLNAAMCFFGRAFSSFEAAERGLNLFVRCKFVALCLRKTL